jgi:hypothetical protein
MKTFLILFEILFLILMTAPNAKAVIVDADRAEFAIKNLLGGKNPGFESGTAGWTASGGSLARTTSGSNFMGIGKATGTWDSNSGGQTLTSPSYTVTNGTAGVPGIAMCKVMVASGTATTTMNAWNGSANLGASVNVPTSTVAQYIEVPFVFGAAGSTVAIQFTSVASNEPLISIDDCGIYPSDGMTLHQINQAQFIGSAKIAGTSSCSWSRTNTSIGAFSTTAACPGPTVISNPGPGVIQTTDADLPRFTVNSLPPGTYRVKITFSATGATSGQIECYAINDGTTTSPNFCGISQASSRLGLTTAEAVFTYTNTANITYELFGASQSGAVGVDVSNGPPAEDVSFEIYRFPSSSQLAATISQLPASWTGYHDQTCAWTNTTTASAWTSPSADASCGFVEVMNNNFGTVASTGSKTPGITWTPQKTGRYSVCVSGSLSDGVSSTGIFARLNDGSGTMLDQWNGNGSSVTNTQSGFKLCGIVNATSITAQTAIIQILRATASAGTENLGTGSQGTSSLFWQIFALDQAFPMPQLFAPASYIWLDGGNGLGGSTSGETNVRNFTTVRASSGQDITYTARTTTNGDKFTVNTTGVYSMCVSDTDATLGKRICITKNGTSLSSSCGSTANGETLTMSQVPVANIQVNPCITLPLNNQDILRVQHETGGTPATTATEVKLFMSRVQ